MIFKGDKNNLKVQKNYFCNGTTKSKKILKENAFTAKIIKII